MKNSFVFKGKRYSPDNSDLLCKYDIDGLTSKTLYVSPKGAFFIVEESEFLSKTSISGFELIDREKAKEFTDKHPEGIEEKAYIKVFGEPEEG